MNFFILIIDVKKTNLIHITCICKILINICPIIVKVNFGKNVQIIEPVNLYECEINNCFIGFFVEIQSNVVLGKKNNFFYKSFIFKNYNNCFKKLDIDILY